MPVLCDVSRISVLGLMKTFLKGEAIPFSLSGEFKKPRNPNHKISYVDYK